MPNLKIENFVNARQSIDKFIINTPLIPSNFLSKKIDGNFLLKLEMTQPIGAFKIRGAMNAILNLDSNIKGVTCCSTGNHGKGVAYAAKTKGINSTICMSSNVPKHKIKAIKNLGADIKIIGKSQDEAELYSLKFEKENNYKYISPFDDEDVIAGQGTIAFELLEKNPNLETVLIPLSGGGLAGGIAFVLKHFKPSIKVYGISMRNGAAMHESIKEGKPIEVREHLSLADSLQGGIGLNNKFTFELCKKYLDDIILVSEEQIYKSLQTIYYEDNIVCEGACVVGIAAVLNNLIPNLKGEVATIISGKNIDMGLHSQIISGKDVNLGNGVIEGSKYEK